MKKIGLFYATKAERTSWVAEKIQKEFGEDKIEVVPIEQAWQNDFAAYDCFIVGASTLVLCNLGGLRRSDLGLILIDWFIQRGDYGALSFTRGRNCGGIEAKRFPPVSGNLNLISSLKCRCQHAER